MNAVAISEDDLPSLEQARAELKEIPSMHIESSRFNNIEIIPLHVNKGETVKRLAAYYNISIENTIVFGDGENDITMLRAAGIGVAIGNAEDAIKAVADAVTASNDEDGIVAFLDSINL